MSLLSSVKWIEFPSHKDPRGVLTSIESGRDIPFAVQRIFYVHDVLEDRGGHAHTDTDQVVFAVAGSLKIELSDGVSSQTHDLNSPTRGLYVPRMIFVRLFHFSPGGVCLVLASTHYDMRKSLRSWPEYLKAVGGKAP